MRRLHLIPSAVQKCKAAACMRFVFSRQYALAFSTAQCRFNLRKCPIPHNNPTVFHQLSLPQHRISFLHQEWRNCRAIPELHLSLRSSEIARVNVSAHCPRGIFMNAATSSSLCGGSSMPLAYKPANPFPSATGSSARSIATGLRRSVMRIVSPAATSFKRAERVFFNRVTLVVFIWLN